MRSIVITGGDGFIGTHLTKYLIEKGYEVYAVVLPESRTKQRLLGFDHVHLVEGRIDNYREMLPDLPYAPAAFFHLAWEGVTPDLRNDIIYQMKNIELSVNAVNLASEIAAGSFIFPGSTMEYIHYGKPIDKDAIPTPSNAYGAAKVSCRYTCSVLCKDLGVPFIYSVISGIYSEDRNDDNVIYYTISKLLHRERPSLTKLEQLWDYIHIDDVVYGLCLLAEKGKSDTFYALGHGDNCPLYEYIYKIRDLIDPGLPLGIGDIPYSHNIIPCSCVNLDTIYRDTGFVPRISFEDGIARVIAEVRKKELGE